MLSKSSDTVFCRLWLVVPFISTEADMKHSAAFLSSVICAQKEMKDFVF